MVSQTTSSAQENLEKCKSDLEEATSLHEKASRSWVKEALGAVVQKATARVADAQRELEAAQRETAAESATAPLSDGVKLATSSVPEVAGEKWERITKYSFDQDSNKVTVYIFLDGIGSLPEENITSTLAEKSAEVLIRGYNGRNIRFLANPLCEESLPSKNKMIVKADKIVLKIFKKEPGTDWSHVDDRDKVKEAARKERIKGMTTEEMLKDMYDHGDEETKLKLAKAYAEGQSKREARNFGY